MKKNRTLTSAQNCRSLLQKAVRRGAASVAEKATIHLIQKGEVNWLKNRLGIIVFEESWTHTSEIQFTTNESLLIKQYTHLAQVPKNKNAAGLGSLAYELSKGDESVLVSKDPASKHIKIVAEAIKRPDDFWGWIRKSKTDEASADFLKRAEIGFKLAGWPWDKAFALASAYLLIISEASKTVADNISEPTTFPYWVAIDKHTPEGKIALAKCSKEFNISKTTLGWIQFYLESAKCQDLQASFWWEREKEWRLRNEGITKEKAESIWCDACKYLKNTLSDQGCTLKNDINRSFDLYQNTLKKQENLI